MKFKAELIKIDDKPNKNGRIYTEEALKNIEENILNKNVVYYSFEGNYDITEYTSFDIVGKIIDVKRENNTLSVIGEFIDNVSVNPIIEIIKDLKCLYLSTIGYGCYSLRDNTTIEEYEYDSCSIIKEPAFDVKPIELIEELNATN